MKLVQLALLSFILAACSESPESDAQMSASLRLGWIASGSFSGEITGMRLFAEAHNLNLEIQAGSPGLNTIALVASGQNTFGTLAADEVLLANESGADLVIVGVINDISPGGFVSLQDSGIHSPVDFPGHTVGVLPFGSTTLLYEAMLAASGVDRTLIQERTISPDLRPFIEGVYDVHPVFVYDETVTLDQQGIRYNLIEPKNYGVEFKGPVYFTTRKIVMERPEIVEAFVHTMTEGWNYALANPDEAIQLLDEFAPEIDPEREKLVLLKGVDYFRAYNSQPVNSDPTSWNQMAQRLVEFGRLKSLPDLTQVVRLEWVNSFYRDQDEGR